MSKSFHIVIDARIRQASTGRYVDRLLHYLQNLDKTNRYTVLLSRDDSWQPEAKNFSVKHVRFPQFSFNPLDQILFPIILYRLRAGLVHFTMTQQPILYFGNIVTTTHDMTMLDYTHKKNHSVFFHFLKTSGYRLLMWWGHRKSERIIVPTYSVKKALVRHHGFALPKVDVTYESGELPKLKTSSQPAQLDRTTRFIVYVGTAFPHKNLPNLVKAFTHLSKLHKDLHLVIVGKKEFFYEQFEKECVVKSPVKDKIILTGFVTDEELVWIYKHALAYVFPTLSEGFGLPGLEAMSYDLPVLASDIDVLKEVYGDVAYYFDANNPKNIAEAINVVISSKPLRDSLIVNGRKRIKQFSWAKMAGETLEVYKKTL